MGILKEMFDENNEDRDFEKREEVVLACGSYKSNKETILSGYKTFQKKYTVKNLVLKMILCILALASSIIMMMSSETPSPMSILFIMVCVVIGVYFVSEPFKNRKNVGNSLDDLEGTEYNAKITDRSITISTVIDPSEKSDLDESTENEETTSTEEISADGEEEKSEEEEIPATVIHLDSPIVDFLDKEDMFIVCVKKSYVFVIPKSAFTEDEVQNTREKLSAIMGIRFKIID